MSYIPKIFAKIWRIGLPYSIKVSIGKWEGSKGKCFLTGIKTKYVWAWVDPDNSWKVENKVSSEKGV